MSQLRCLAGKGSLPHALTGLAFCLAVSCVNAQQTYDIDVDGARPLNEALFKINERYATPVIYEEIAYEFEGDLVAGEKIGLRPEHHYPKGGTLHVSINEPADGYSAIQTLMAAFKESGLPGRYSVTLNQNAVCILPATTKDSNGKDKRVAPILNTVISAPRQTRSIPDTINLIVSQLSQSTGKRVVVLNQPYPPDEMVTWGADKEPAIDALARLDAAMGPVTFRLLFDPSDRTYYFSLTPLAAVAPPETSPAEATKSSGANPSGWFVKAPRK